MPIPTKDDFFAKSQPRSDLVAFPDLGEGVELRIRGYSLGESIAITEQSTMKDQDGAVKGFSQENNILLSVVAAVQEPTLTIEDIPRLKQCGKGIIDRILDHAARLSGNTPDAFAEAREMFQRNPYLRRVYEVCRTQFGRLPSEMNCTQEEFNTTLIEMEMAAEAEAEAVEQMKR